MTVTITLPDELVTKLQSRAETENLSPEVLAIHLLSNALEVEVEPDDFPTPEEVVAKIKATPPNPAAIHPATASLADLLMNAPEDPDFDLEAWQRDWAKVEAEMKAITRANDLAKARIVN